MQSCGLGLEGIVSKLADAPYRDGRTRNWLKTKCTQARRTRRGRLHRPVRLAYRIRRAAARRCSTNAASSRTSARSAPASIPGSCRNSTSRLEAITVANRVRSLRPCRSAACTGCGPILVAEVEFTERTRDGLLRHPSFRGLREDKGPTGGRAWWTLLESTSLTGAEGTTASVARRNSEPANKPAKGRVDEPMPGDAIVCRRQADASGSRVVAGARHHQSVHLARYYERIESWLLPSLRRRPLALLRCPEGRTRQCFFQKHPGESMSDGDSAHADPREGRRGDVHVRRDRSRT